MTNKIDKKTLIPLALVITIIIAVIAITTSWNNITFRLTTVETKVDKVIAILELSDKIVKD